VVGDMVGSLQINLDGWVLHTYSYDVSFVTQDAASSKRSP